MAAPTRAVDRVGGLLEKHGVVITGAGRGLGRAFALAAAQAGARVVVNDIDVEEAEAVVAEIVAAGGEAIANGGSVADWNDAGAMVESCVSAFGRIDGLVNNAITYGHFGPPWEENGGQMRKEVEVGVLGTLFCGVHALRRMREQRSGSIVNLTSTAAQGVLGHSTYNTIKGASLSTTYSWALELHPYGVRVNALSPGAYTRGHELAAAAGTYRASSKANAVPPEAVAPAAVYLLSDLSMNLSGQVVALLGARLGLLGAARLMDHMVTHESWTAESIADVMNREYSRLLQPVGNEATTYQLSYEAGTRSSH